MHRDKRWTHQRLVSRDRILAFFVIAAIVWVVAPPATAHAPSDMSISYNELSKQLNVVITHPVPNPNTHYIQEVQLKINGKIVSDVRYTGQPSPDKFTYTYPLLPNPGDAIEATAYCSIAGSTSRTMYVPGPTATAPGQTGTPPSTQKAALGIVPVLGALLGLLGAWRK